MGPRATTNVPPLVTLPPGVPTPHELASEQEAADYVLAMLELDPERVVTFVRRARELDITLMRQGPGARIVTPDPTKEREPLMLATPTAGDVVWVVGLRTLDGVPHWQLADLLGIPPAWEEAANQTTHEFFVTMDALGNFVESSTLDVEEPDGRHMHAAPWRLEDILSLPAPDQ
jgi:hypothetical protein